MFKHLSRILLPFASGLLLAGAAQADPAPAGAAPTQGPDVELKATTEQIRTLISQNYAGYKASPDKFYKAVDEVVVPRFDVAGIARLVLGANYRAASEDQRTRFATAFKDMLVHSYANAMLDNYNSVKITWMTPRMAANATDAAVNTSLVRSNGQNFDIGFRVHVVDGDWKVYDIAVENVSLVLNFRTQLNAEIKRTSLDDVISRMQAGQFKPDSNQNQKSN